MRIRSGTQQPGNDNTDCIEWFFKYHAWVCLWEGRKKERKKRENDTRKIKTHPRTGKTLSTQHHVSPSRVPTTHIPYISFLPLLFFFFFLSFLFIHTLFIKLRTHNQPPIPSFPYRLVGHIGVLEGIVSFWAILRLLDLLKTVRWLWESPAAQTF